MEHAYKFKDLRTWLKLEVAYFPSFPLLDIIGQLLHTTISNNKQSISKQTRTPSTFNN